MARLLSRNECSRIRYKAKTLGAVSMRFNNSPYTVNFEHTYVTFAFFPLQFTIAIKENPGVGFGLLSIADEAVGIKKDVDSALELGVFLEKLATEFTA
jgi:hypothetical protein